MARAYSEDLRSRIVDAVEGGLSCTAAAQRFGVSISCAVKLMQRVHRTGSLEPAPRGRKPFALAGHEVLVSGILAERPDLTLDELTEEVAQHGIEASRSAVGRFLKALGLTLKKSRSGPPSRIVRTLRPRVRPGAERSLT